MEKDHLLEIYKVETEKYNKTREIHWKLNTAIWTLGAVAIYAKLHHDIIVDTWSALNVVISFSFCILHFFYISAFHGSLARSLWRMYDMATLLLRDGSDPIEGQKIGEREYIHWTDLPFAKISMRKKLLALWGKLQTWDYLQIGITLFLVLIYLFVSPNIS